MWLPDALAYGPWRNLTAPHTGYLQTFSRLVAEVAAIGPLTWAPWWLCAAAVIALLLPAVLVWRRGGRLGLGMRWRFALCSGYLLLPYSGETYANLTNAQWRLALAALAIFMLPAATGRWSRAVDVGVVGLSALSGPMSVLAWPGHALLAGREPGSWKRWLLGISSVGAAVQIAVLLRAGGRVAGWPTWDGLLLLRVVGGQVGLGSLVGVQGAAWVDGHAWAPWAWGAALVLVGLVLVAALRAAPHVLLPLLLLALVQIGAALLSGTAEDPAQRLFELGTPPAGGRYWLLPIAVTHVAIGVLLLRPRTRAERGLGVLVAAQAMIGITLDFRLPAYSTQPTRRALAAYESAAPGATIKVPLAPPPWEARWTKPERPSSSP